jgi:hypothetical protein
MELIGGKSLKINSRAKMDRPMMAWADGKKLRIKK